MEGTITIECQRHSFQGSERSYTHQNAIYKRTRKKNEVKTEQKKYNFGSRKATQRKKQKMCVFSLLHFTNTIELLKRKKGF